MRIGHRRVYFVLSAYRKTTISMPNGKATLTGKRSHIPPLPVLSDKADVCPNRLSLMQILGGTTCPGYTEVALDSCLSKSRVAAAPPIPGCGFDGMALAALYKNG
jgi:hypothetical protein